MILVKIWTNAGQIAGGCFDNPSHVIVIRGKTADTALPGLRFDVVKREISFEWEDMLYKFFREEVEVNRRLKPLRSRLEDIASAGLSTKEHPAPFLEAFCRTNIEINQSSEIHSRAVRRARMMEHYKAHGFSWLDKEYPWHDGEQAQCQERMKVCARLIGFWGAETDETDEEEEEFNWGVSYEEDIRRGDPGHEESGEEGTIEIYGSDIDIDEVGWGDPEDSDTWSDVEEQVGKAEVAGDDTDIQGSQDQDSAMHKALRYRPSYQ